MFFVVILCIVSMGYLFIVSIPMTQIAKEKVAYRYLRGYVRNKSITRRIGFNTSLIDAECFSADGNGIEDNYDRIDFRIIVLTYDRAKSLTRLLNSINNAKYGSDKVQLDIWIDRNGNRNVNENVVKTATLFKFLHGSHRTCVHRTHVGIIGQWISVSIM